MGNFMELSVMRVQHALGHFLLISILIVFGWSVKNGWCLNISVNGAELDKVVATVNDFEIMQDDLAPEVKRELKKYEKYGLKKATPELMKTLNRRALDRIIDNEVLSQAIQKHDLPDFDAQARKEIASMKEGFSSPESFAQYLQSRRMTEQELLISLKNKMRVDAYLEDKDILHFEPAEDEIKSFYEQRKESFAREERVEVRHILIQVPSNAGESEKNSALQKTEEIRNQLENGKDFARLAEEYSDCLRSKNDGGNLGYIKRGFMPEEFDRVAFTIEKNTISEVFASPFGYHLLEVLEWEPAGYLLYEDARQFIIKYIESKQMNKVRSEHIGQLRKQARIQIFLD
ncbi:MAG: peptidylprolyl isomerase [Desulfobulbaceae bacterium]|nr:peptidylprolyl isomerase [Desulfobulbaceae bacterium]